jgi:hypothetical protein
MLDIERTNTIAEVLLKLLRKGTVLAIAKYSHPDDDFLFLVLIQTDRDFVVWDYNNITGGCSTGNYFPYHWGAAACFEDRFERHCS